MPRRSRFVVRLTEQERAELEARCKKYTSPHRDVVRAKIVLLSQGLGNDRIAEADEFTEFVVTLPQVMFTNDGSRA
jgi:hypothetical protein